MSNAKESSPPWYIPLLWPWANVVAAISLARNSGEDGKPVDRPAISAVCSLSEHVITCAASVRSFLLAIFCIYAIHGGADPATGYPAFGRAAQLEVRWIAPLLVRNVLGTWLIAGFWDWFLYFSPMSSELKPFKMNQTYPSFSQIRHDALVTTMASVCGTAIEVLLCYGWASGWWVATDTFTTLTWLQGITILHWRCPHFYLTHRAMHPWKLPGLSNRFDPGYHLYRHIHSLHHKSYNPTAFSGTNMHPIEAIIYYSAALIPVLISSGKCHPAVALGCLVDCGVGAWLGHDGFQWPGEGDCYHLLHHEHFDCNYGTSHVPLDKWFGTFVPSKRDANSTRTSMDQAGREEEIAMSLHPKSKTAHVD